MRKVKQPRLTLRASTKAVFEIWNNFSITSSGSRPFTTSSANSVGSGTIRKVDVFITQTERAPANCASTKFTRRILKAPALAAPNWKQSAVGAHRYISRANRSGLAVPGDHSDRALRRSTAPFSDQLQSQRSAPWKSYRKAVRSWRIETEEEWAPRDQRNEG